MTIFLSPGRKYIYMFCDGAAAQQWCSNFFGNLPTALADSGMQFELFRVMKSASGHGKGFFNFITFVKNFSLFAQIVCASFGAF